MGWQFPNSLYKDAHHNNIMSNSISPSLLFFNALLNNTIAMKFVSCSLFVHSPNVKHYCSETYKKCSPRHYVMDNFNALLNKNTIAMKFVSFSLFVFPNVKHYCSETYKKCSPRHYYTLWINKTRENLRT
jgi:hypothetical protein